MLNNLMIVSRGLLLGVLLLAASLSFAQGDTGSQAIGLPEHGSFSGSDFDSVQVNNGNLHIEIPLYSVPGRGLSSNFKLVYDSKGWYEWSSNFVLGTPSYVRPRGVQETFITAPPAHNMSWTLAGPLTNGLGRGLSFHQYSCLNGQITVSHTTYREPNGTAHDFPEMSAPGNVCNFYAPSYALATDGGGVMMQGGAFIAKDGTRVYSTLDGQGQTNSWVMEDSNGNKITRAVSSGVGASTITDTLGRTLNATMVLNIGTGKYELKYYDSSGTQQTIQFTMTTVNLHTNLCWYQNTGSDGPCNEWVGSWQAPSVIQLPNGMQYNISYVQNSDGQISSIQIPTGATISYTWGNSACHCADVDNAGPKVKSRTVTSGGQTATWNYTYTGNASTKVTDPQSNDTVHTFQQFASGGIGWLLYDILDQHYQGPTSSNVLLKTVATVYQTTVGKLHLPLSVTTTWNQQGGLASRIESDYYVQSPYSGIYESWANVTEKREYGFGTGGTWGALARKTDYQYAHISGNTNYNVNYFNLGIADRVTQKTVYDGSNNIVADSKTAYDGAAVATTSGVPNHDYAIGTYRGNPTQSSVWRNLPTVAWLNTNNTFDDLGHVLSTIDPGGHPTNFGYSPDSWATTGVVYNCGIGTNTQAYLVLASAPDTVNSQGATVHHRSKATYYPCTGQKQSAQDENDILAARTGTTFTYDLVLRPLTTTQADGGQISYSYTDTSNAVSVTTNLKQDSGHNIGSTSYMDGLGRVKGTKLVDPEGDVFVDTTYDLLGRKATLSNPYRSTSDPTYGITSYQYDSLSRATKEIPPDGGSSSNNVVTTYGGQTTGVLGLSTTVTDQAGHQRKSVSDALGCLVDVWEPDPTSGSLVNETLYGYDVLNNLLRVDQKGGTTDTTKWRTRTSTYDSLSRLLTNFNPESGTTTWTYDNDSNVLTKKDARNVTITYNYDQLHRVATVGATHAMTYSNGDPAVDYYFDQTSYNGLTIAEGVNHRTGMSDRTGQTAWKFDPEGRTLSERKTVNISGLTPSAVTKTLSYTYNLDGSMASLIYPSGRVVNYSYNTAGRAISIVDPTGPINYVTWDCPQAGIYCYAPTGAEMRLKYGATGTFSGMITGNSYNNRLQPSVFSAATQGSGTHTVMSLAFSFNQGPVGSSHQQRFASQDQQQREHRTQRQLQVRPTKSHRGRLA